MAHRLRQLRRHPRAAFTLVELCMGLVITSLVMGALAAFSLAMTTAWNSAGKSQAIAIMGNQGVVRIQDAVRKARMIGVYRAGSSDGSSSGAAVLLWMDDTNGDDLIQGNEVAMIVHNTTAHTLELYDSGQADQLTSWSYASQFMASATLDDFKTNRNCRTLLSGVYGAVFKVVGTGGTTTDPSLQFALKLMVDDRQSATSHAVGGSSKLIVQYGTASVRAPKAQPAS